MGTHLRVLSESYPMNTNKAGFKSIFKMLTILCLGSSLSIERVKVISIQPRDFSILSDKVSSVIRSTLAEQIVVDSKVRM